MTEALFVLARGVYRRKACLLGIAAEIALIGIIAAQWSWRRTHVSKDKELTT